MRHVINDKSFVILAYDLGNGRLNMHAGADELSVVKDMINFTKNPEELRRAIITLRHATDGEISALRESDEDGLGKFLTHALTNPASLTPYHLGKLPPTT